LPRGLPFPYLVTVIPDPGSLPAAVALFAYNRPAHLERCLASLRANPEAAASTGYFFIDGPRTPADEPLVEQVRRIALTSAVFRRTVVVDRGENRGLSGNVIDGVTQVLDTHARAIVVEDDLVVSPAFLGYMNQALERYERAPSVFSVSGYNYPRAVLRSPPDYGYDAFFVPRHMCWGWGTWRDRWQHADWEIRDYRAVCADRSWQRSFRQVGLDLPQMLAQYKGGDIDSWAIRWTYAHFANHAVCLVPVHSFVNNAGVDGSGSHMAASNRYYHRRLNCRTAIRLPAQVYVDPVIAFAFSRTERRSLPSRISRRILRLLNLPAAPRRKPAVAQPGANACIED